MTLVIIGGLRLGLKVSLKISEVKDWAESLFFREYDFKWINDRLKGLEYKKTEWDKINHMNFQVIDDKYM